MNLLKHTNNVNIESIVIEVLKDFSFSNYKKQFDVKLMLQSEKRDRLYNYMRCFYAYYMYYNTNITTEEIGNFLNRNYSSVVAQTTRYLESLLYKYPEIVRLEILINKYGYSHLSVIENKLRFMEYKFAKLDYDGTPSVH